ncbi:unnamed protein product [Paramecium sonneborni]|uniref:Uncharacterized protein n=1 Tax=Paramecium sonneborni TaxID=65129 RepID=A0A8S1LEX7_9CILI|nr:unnamed protein product [Paramecium sonneborni]
MLTGLQWHVKLNEILLTIIKLVKLVFKILLKYKIFFNWLKILSMSGCSIQDNKYIASF